MIKFNNIQTPSIVRNCLLCKAESDLEYFLIMFVLYSRVNIDLSYQKGFIEHIFLSVVILVKLFLVVKYE